MFLFLGVGFENPNSKLLKIKHAMLGTTKNILMNLISTLSEKYGIHKILDPYLIYRSLYRIYSICNGDPYERRT